MLLSALRRRDAPALRSVTLIYAAFIAGLCSIIYELLIASTVSYFLGDGVKYFSLTIGVYMAAMGAGSFASKYIDGDLLRKFVIAELILGITGGLSVPALYIAYAYSDAFIPVYIGFTAFIGFLIGLEIPFLTRLTTEYNRLKSGIANILSFDYLGALVATVSFPFLLLPVFGVYRSSLIFGLINMSIGFVILHLFRDEIGKKATKSLKSLTIIFSLTLVGMIILSGHFLKHWDNHLYEDRVVHSAQSRYQRIVLTRDRNDIRLFLDGNLQFSSADEHRYHESLIHVPMSIRAGGPVKRVLLLGAGDGMAVRELLKYPDIREIILVDLDKAVIDLARSNHYIAALNQHSLDNPKVKLITADAFVYLAENTDRFDFIVCDLPDPNNNSLTRLYSKQFYKLIRRNLTADGLFVTQATSPYFAADAFWSIVTTVKAAGFAEVRPYHTQIPSFGDWGFVTAARTFGDINIPAIGAETKFLDRDHFASLFSFPKDIRRQDVKVNMLDRPVLLGYYLNGWREYAR